jgi:hypothetical protein
MANTAPALHCGCGATTVELLNDSRGSGLGAAYRRIAEGEAADARRKAGIPEPPPPRELPVALFLPQAARLQGEAAFAAQKLLEKQSGDEQYGGGDSGNLNALGALGRMLHYGTEWGTTPESMTLVYSYDVNVVLPGGKGLAHVLPMQITCHDDTWDFGQRTRLLTSGQCPVVVVLAPFPQFVVGEEANGGSGGESEESGESEGRVSGSAVRARVRNMIGEVLATQSTPASHFTVVKLVRCLAPDGVEWTYDPQNLENDRAAWARDATQRPNARQVRDEFQRLCTSPQEAVDANTSCSCGERYEGPLHASWSSTPLDWSDPATFQPAISAAIAEGVGALAQLESGRQSLARRTRCVVS